MAILKDKAVRHLAKHVDEIISKQNDKGEFFPDAYFVPSYPTSYQQFAYYPLAWLYVLNHPENPWMGNGRLLAAVERSLRNNLAIMQPDGRTLDSSHDHSPEPRASNWRNFTWLRTWDLIGEHLDKKLAAETVAAMTTIFDAQRHEAEKAVNEKGFRENSNVRNHPVWHLLATYALAKKLGRQKDLNWVAQEFEKIAACQHPVGCWFEHDGPVPVYQHVTINGLSHYQHLSQSKLVTAALDKALSFERLFLYPNGVPVETIDGRTRYTGYCMSILCAAWAPSEQGRAMLHFQLDRLLEQPLGGGYQVHGGWLGLPFFTQFARDLPDTEPAETTRPSALAGDGVHEPEQLPVRVIRKGPWTVVLSAFTRKEDPQQRWMLDYQSHLSVFHEHAGLIIGGGGAKRQAEYSLFNGDFRPLGLPTLAISGAAETTGKSAARISLRFSTYVASVEARIENDAVTLIARVDINEGARYDSSIYMQLPFLMEGPEPVTTGSATRREADLQDEILAEELKDSIGREGKFTITGLKGAHALLRVMPYNTHWRDGRSPAGKMMGIVAQPLASGVARELTIKVPD